MPFDSCWWTPSNKINIFSGNSENLRPHEWLCVRQNATAEEINRNYKKLSLATHPDQNNQCSDKLFMLIKNAKDVLLAHPGNSCMAMDYDQQMEMVLVPFTAVLNKPKYQAIVAQLNTMPKSAADCATFGYGVFLVDPLIEFAKHFALEGMFKAYKKALESAFVCRKCRKQMHLDDICYCHKATTKCHCNARKCCDTKLEECGNFC
ncbi:hypothetical protein niasHT_029885 [Heterodera trifolii]|uniref:J domain-containing protein n=1 Tax=Heterodera trifolii TaxID=157864 RepID=A0ABD2KB51_9BILA